MTNFIIIAGLMSLIAPIFVLLFQLFRIKANTDMIFLCVWPSSIMLLSLGGNSRSYFNIAYVWSISIFTNVVLYVIVGSLFFYLFHN